MKRIYNGVEVTYQNETDYNLSNVVYLITFPNGKYYVGSTTKKLRRRVSNHCVTAITIGKQILISSAIRDFMKFDIKILDDENDKNALLKLEEFYTVEYKSDEREFGYNQGSGSNPSDAKKGRTPTEESKIKISEALSIYLYSIESLNTGWLTRNEIANMIGVEKTRVSTAARIKCKCSGYIISRKKINQ